MTEPFPPILIAVSELVKRILELPADTDKVGGDLSYDPADDFYVWLGLLPGGSADATEGSWIVDIDVFGTHYATTFGIANRLEAALVGRAGHRTSIMRVDNVYQNEGPSDRPWEDDDVYRLGATYVFTARRPSAPRL